MSGLAKEDCSGLLCSGEWPLKFYGLEASPITLDNEIPVLNMYRYEELD